MENKFWCDPTPTRNRLYIKELHHPSDKIYFDGFDGLEIEKWGKEKPPSRPWPLWYHGLWNKPKLCYSVAYPAWPLLPNTSNHPSDQCRASVCYTWRCVGVTHDTLLHDQHCAVSRCYHLVTLCSVVRILHWCDAALLCSHVSASSVPCDVVLHMTLLQCYNASVTAFVTPPYTLPSLCARTANCFPRNKH